MLKTVIINLFNWKKYIVYRFEPACLKSMDSLQGPVSLESIREENIGDIVVHFPREKIPIFHEKLRRGCVGVFARHNSEVVGYQWRKDYEAGRTIKADGYVPLKGRFSHIHFARVSSIVRGRGILQQMMTYLVHTALDKGFTDIYTDCETDNAAANRGVTKFGFREAFRLLVIRVFGRNLALRYKARSSLERGVTFCFEPRGSGI